MTDGNEAAGTWLAMDASTEYLGVAMEGPDGRRAGISVATGLRHGETLLPLVNELLHALGRKRGELCGVICSRGPGSFTGLRIGLSTARGISAGLGIPLYGVSTLDAMGWWGRTVPHPLLCLLDARKGRFYGAWYQEGTRLAEPEDASLAVLAHQHEGWICTPHAQAMGDGGSGMPVIPAGGSCFWIESLLDLGKEMHQKGLAMPEDQGPEYLRDSLEDLGIHVKGF